jgi:FtsP/CotA-like multicopper oxidase with cupredoxin domain
MRISGSDMGRYEAFHRTYTDILSPGERLAVEFPMYDTTTLYLNHVIARSDLPADAYPMITLATIKVLPEAATPSYLDAFNLPAASPHAVASLDSFRTDFDRPPDRRLLLTVAMDHSAMGHAPLAKAAHDDPNGKGVEWEEHPTMGMDNSASNAANTRWIIRDTDAGTENHAIDWAFARGSRVKIRIYNDSLSMHPMPHPIHFHGQRFLVVDVNGKRNQEMVWKDTYLVGKGETADILLDASNPGLWMAHCHIAEHLETMMMFEYRVE